MKYFTVLLALLAMACAVPQVQAEVRVNQADALKAATTRPAPQYSPMAKQMRVTGEVEVEVRISAKGDVDDVKAIRGNALLTSPVVDTLKRWKFTPFTENGAPAPAVANIKFNFTL